MELQNEIWKDIPRLEGVYQRNILQVANRTEFNTGRVRSQAGGYVWKFYEPTV